MRIEMVNKVVVSDFSGSLPDIFSAKFERFNLEISIIKVYDSCLSIDIKKLHTKTVFRP